MLCLMLGKSLMNSEKQQMLRSLKHLCNKQCHMWMWTHGSKEKVKTLKNDIAKQIYYSCKVIRRGRGEVVLCNYGSSHRTFQHRFIWMTHRPSLFTRFLYVSDSRGASCPDSTCTVALSPFTSLWAKKSLCDHKNMRCFSPVCRPPPHHRPGPHVTVHCILGNGCTHIRYLISLPCALDEFQVFAVLTGGSLHTPCLQSEPRFDWICASPRDATTFITLH